MQQDRRARGSKLVASPPSDFQEAFRQLEGTSWEEDGSGAVVHRRLGPPVNFSEDSLSRLKIHQGNPEAIHEIIQETMRPRVRPQQKRGIRKRGFEKRIR